METTFKIIFSILGVALVLCFVGLFFTYQFEDKCRQQGGFPLKGVCLKADTIKVVY